MSNRVLEKPNASIFRASSALKKGAAGLTNYMELHPRKKLAESNRINCRNHNISKGVKIRIFHTNVKSLLLYGCKTWKTINQITKRLQTFINKCLRRIMNIKWTDKITNEELWRITKQKPMEIQIKRRKW